MVRNPSELARLEDELEFWREKAQNLGLSRSSRQAALNQVRSLERQLGINGET